MMRSLLKVMLILGSLFALTFIAGRLLGILTTENVRLWLEWAQSVDPVWVISLVVLLLYADLFVAVPTLTITILAGFFVGFPAGAAAALAGMSLASFTGFWISRRWGEGAIAFLIKDPEERSLLARSFQQSGPVMIMLSRAVPIVPEVTACIAGATGMRFVRYVTFYAIGTLPYVMVASYAGSISSIENPQPAIYAILLLNFTLWSGWVMFRRRAKLSREIVQAEK
jgi:uncharacterized membrane protein YdjX (TVP38/TMEM64 family)